MKNSAINRMREWAENGHHEVGKSQVEVFAADVRELLADYERLCRVEQDHINVLKAALYNERDGIDLLNRLTTYALQQRPQAPVAK